MNSLIEVMNGSSEKNVRKAAAMLLVELLTNTKGQQLYFEKVELEYSPTSGYFTINKLPSELLELLYSNKNTL